MDDMMEKENKKAEASAKKEKKKKEPGQKRRIRKRVLIPVILGVAVVGFFIYSSVTAGSAPMPVVCSTAYTGSVEERISASGKVGSAESKTYFAPAGARIEKLNIKAGDSVKAGDVLLTFDTSDLEQSKKRADLEVTSASSSYQSAVQESNENAGKYSDASLGLEELKQMKADQEQYVKGLQYELEDDKNAKREDLYEWDKQLEQELNYQSRRLSEKQAHGRDTEEVSEVIDNITSQRADVQHELSMIDSDENIKQKQRLIDAEQEKLEDMTEEISKREAKQDSSEPGIMNSYDRQGKEASVETAKLSADQAAEDLTAAQEGVIAEFDGIVTEVKAVEGATVEKGFQLFTVENSEKVQVTVELSKYDLDKVKEGQEADVTIAGSSYKGEVSNINRMAQNNAQNTPVVYADVTVSDPDENIFLGVEGKANIKTGASEGAVLVPYEAVNTDKDGDFCYVVRDGVIVRQDIVTGISGDTDVEIKEGILEGDTVVMSSNQTLTEGMQVTPVIQ